MKTYTFFDRLAPKSLNGLMVNHFKKQYNLSPQAAQSICQDAVFFRSIFGAPRRSDGQVIYYAVRLGEPPSKRIRDCQLVPVRLSLIEAEDLSYQKTHGLQALMQHVIVRLAREAYEQGAVLNTEDLAYLLHISESTVKRHKRLLKGSGVSLLLRGETADMGPASCHRVPIVELFLQGYSETEIAQRLHHGLERVEEYLYDFLRVSLLLKDGYAVGMAGRLAKLSKAKVTSLQRLYERLSHEPFYREPLARVLELFELRRRLRKRGVNR